MVSEQETLIAIWRQASQTHTSLWTSYIAVVLAALLFCFTETYAGAARFARACLLVVLLAFMSVNAWSIWDNLAVYNAAASELASSPAHGERSRSVASSIREIHAGHLTTVHVVLDACVIAVAASRGRG